jgi:photosystem II stability/assembly factor-like uncharacterized protein
MNEPMAYNSLDGSLWVFPDGPNHKGLYLGCADSGDVSAPEGDVTLTMCFDGKGKWKTVGKKVSPPGPVTTTVTTLTYRQRNYLEKLRCDFGLMYLQNDGGRSDEFCNHQRATILDGVRITSRTLANLTMREAQDDSTHAFDLTANPPILEAVGVEGNRKNNAEDDDFNDVAMLPEKCGTVPALDGVAVSAGAGVYAAGDVYVTHDGGQTWTKTAAQPNLIASNLMSCVILDLCAGIRRIIVAEEAAANSYIAYSDDDGATWTTVKLLAAATAHGVTHGGGIFALDQHHIWLASALGFIYFSADGGESWTGALAVGGLTTDFTQIEFTADGLNGYAVTTTGVVIRTLNGGTTWALCNGLAGTDDLLTVSVLDEDYAWVGDDSGGLWFTYDGGDTWTQRTGWVGSGTAEINDVSFFNDWIGFMIADTGGIGKVYRTIDGGATWDVLTSDTNAGLLSLVGLSENYAVYVGKISGSTGFTGVVEE